MKKLLMLLALTLLVVGMMAGNASAATNLVVNGDFETGVIDPSTTGYTLVATPGINPNAMADPLTYAIGTNPILYHASWASFLAMGGSGYMMIVNAAETPDTLVWGQTVDVIPGHMYQWDAYVRASYTQNPANLVFMVANGQPVISQSVTSTTMWTKVTGMWLCPDGVTSADLRIVDNTHEFQGDDYVIDSISFAELYSNLGKATGGIKFMAGTTEVQFDFVAMASAAGARGIVKYTASNGNEFMGRVTGYRQSGTRAAFVGEITKTNVSGWSYFYATVEDNGEGIAAAADHGVRILAGSAAYTPDISPWGGWDAFTGNVQLH